MLRREAGKGLFNRHRMAVYGKLVGRHRQEGAISSLRSAIALNSADRRPRLGASAALCCGALAGLLCGAPPASGQSPYYHARNTYGETGILEMPSAHMAPDGELALTFGDVGGTRPRFNLSFQATPWLEVTYRYGRVGQDSYDQGLGLKARLVTEGAYRPAVSVGIRDVWGTGKYAAEYLVASKNIWDFDLTAGLGWGRLADNNVFANPLGSLFPSLKKRELTSEGGSDLGQFFHGRKTGVFAGIAWQTPIDRLKLLAEYSSDHYTYEAALGGGARLNRHSPVNMGLFYQPFDNLALSAGWFYGTTYGVALTVKGNAGEINTSPLTTNPKPPPPAVRTDKQQLGALRLMFARNDSVAAAKQGRAWTAVPSPEQQRQELLQVFMSATDAVRDVEIDGDALLVEAAHRGDRQTQCAHLARLALLTDVRFTSLAVTDVDRSDGLVTICPAGPRPTTIADLLPHWPQVPSAREKTGLNDKLRADLAAQSLVFDAVSLSTSELWLYFENRHYREESQAIGRVARLLMADAPPWVEVFHIVPVKFGVAMQQVTINRGALERVNTTSGLAVELADSVSIGRPPSDPRAPAAFTPRFTWSLAPRLSQYLFDTASPVQIVAYGDAAASVEIVPGLTLGTELTGTIWSNYPHTGSPGSALPHVRSDVEQYLKRGKFGIANLQLAYDARLAGDVFAELKGGYLEDMYMGAGVQILWRPDDSRVSLGGDVYQVWKRDYDRLFGHQGYHVVTGHVSLYYRSPWYGLNFAVHGGRYLAGDYGGTLEVTRRFSTGIEIGAWATFTDVPFGRFGRGSFDKGIFIRIPFDLGMPLAGPADYDLRLASFARDGGQRLAGDDSLYGATLGTSREEISRHLDDLVTP